MVVFLIFQIDHFWDFPNWKCSFFMRHCRNFSTKFVNAILNPNFICSFFMRDFYAIFLYFNARFSNKFFNAIFYEIFKCDFWCNVSMKFIYARFSCNFPIVLCQIFKCNFWCNFYMHLSNAFLICNFPCSFFKRDFNAISLRFYARFSNTVVNAFFCMQF